MKANIIFFIIILLGILGFLYSKINNKTKDTAILSVKTLITMTGTKLATFAGGCFWCMQPSFDALSGVLETTVGYAGGDAKTANYDKVSMGTTDHKEVIQVVYDPKIVSYTTILETFWKQIDPTDPDGQFADKGKQYQTAIFYHDPEQQKEAQASKDFLEASKRYTKPIYTPIIAYINFFPAEEYHQKYYQKSSYRYQTYKKGSGREDYVYGQEDLELPKTKDVILSRGEQSEPKSKDLNNTYQKPSPEQLKKTLSSTQYRVTQEDGTEAPFLNEYRNNKKAGIYVDIVSGEPLFSSLDMFDSGTGWPSFVKPISSGVVEIDSKENIFGGKDTRSAIADSHLGHVFTDGPKERGGLRYCMNSASMAFIPAEQLEKRGYKQFIELFPDVVQQ